MKQYFTGFFTGACLVVSAVMFMGEYIIQVKGE